MNLSMRLAEFIAGPDYAAIPASVIENQKKSIMDAVSITYGASTLGDGCRQMVKIAEDLSAGGRGEATVIGFEKKLPAVWAAFANAAMAHSLDFGDTHQKAPSIPTPPLFQQHLPWQSGWEMSAERTFLQHWCWAARLPSASQMPQT